MSVHQEMLFWSSGKLMTKGRESKSSRISQSSKTTSTNEQKTENMSCLIWEYHPDRFPAILPEY